MNVIFPEMDKPRDIVGLKWLALGKQLKVITVVGCLGHSVTEKQDMFTHS